MELKLNADLAGKKKGDKIIVDTDSDGVIIDRYWRRRLSDAKIDNCVEEVIPFSSKNKDTKK